MSPHAHILRLLAERHSASFSEIVREVAYTTPHDSKTVSDALSFLMSQNTVRMDENYKCALNISYTSPP